VVHRRLLERATSSLWLIDLGFLVWTLDFRITLRIGGRAWSWDLLNDALGMLLCSAGLGALWRLRAGERFRATAAILALAAAVVAAFALLRDLDSGAFEAVAPALPILRWIGLAAIACFCLAVSGLCRAEGGQRAAESWITTLVLFFLASAGIQPVLVLASLLTPTAGTSVERSLPAALLVAVLNCTPVAHSFISTARMNQKRPAGWSEKGPQQTSQQGQNAERPRESDEINEALVAPAPREKLLGTQGTLAEKHDQAQ
jgi:hypothetical protein